MDMNVGLDLAAKHLRRDMRNYCESELKAELREAAEACESAMARVAMFNRMNDWGKEMGFPGVAGALEQLELLRGASAPVSQDAVDRARDAYKALKRYHTADYPDPIGSIRSVADINRNDDAAWRAALEADRAGRGVLIPAPMNVVETDPNDFTSTACHAEGYAEGWNACREAMLGAAPQQGMEGT